MMNIKKFIKKYLKILIPVLYNVNFGHSVPRCILPYNAETIVDYDDKKIIINESIFDFFKE